MREWVVFLAIGAEVDRYQPDMHDLYLRIGGDTGTSRLPYSTYLTIVTRPVLCLVCIVHTYQESQNKVDKGVEIVYSRISSGNYFTCVYQSASHYL